MKGRDETIGGTHRRLHRSWRIQEFGRGQGARVNPKLVMHLIASAFLLFSVDPPEGCIENILF